MFHIRHYKGQWGIAAFIGAILVWARWIVSVHSESRPIAWGDPFIVLVVAGAMGLWGLMLAANMVTRLILRRAPIGLYQIPVVLLMILITLNACKVLTGHSRLTTNLSPMERSRALGVISRDPAYHTPQYMVVHAKRYGSDREAILVYALLERDALAEIRVPDYLMDTFDSEERDKAQMLVSKLTTP